MSRLTLRMTRTGLLAGAVLLACAGIDAPRSPGLAQQQIAQGLTVRLAARVLIEADVDSPLPIQVTPPERIPPQSYLQIRGLPEVATLSEGHSISPGVWAVPLAALPYLAIRVAKEGAGSSTVHARLVSLEGSVLAETRTTVVVAQSYVLGEKQASVAPTLRAVRPPSGLTGGGVQPPPSAPAPAVAALPPQASPQQARPPSQPTAVAPLPRPAERPAVSSPPPRADAPKLSPEMRARAEKMLEAGNRHLGNGNVAAARGFFQRAADAGLAEGAVRLGATFDPVELAAIGVQGLDANPNEARRWYERARDLGAGGMDARLSRLGAR